MSGGERPPSVVTRPLPWRVPLLFTLLLPTLALSFSINTNTLPFPSASQRPSTGYHTRATDDATTCPSSSSPTQSSSSSKSSRVVLYSSPLSRLNLNLPNPLARKPDDSSDTSSASEESLFAKAKAFLSSDLGINDDGSSLSEDFTWIGANLGGGKVLNKKDYLAAGKFFDLRSTFPDLDYRAHDFRVDEDDPNTVRLTARTVGTMRGELRLRTETLPPNGRRMVCPPEAISITFDPATGLVTKLCSGFCLDRLVGNTRGLCGVKAAAVVAGAPPSEWETYPPTTVISRFFGRSVKQLPDDPGAFLAPFPETVMVQLAKGVIAADNGAADPELLAPSFTFCGPYVGPIDKDRFVKAFGGFKLKEAFPDFDPSYTNFRVDPYDPYRVWVDARASGTRTGSLAGSQPTGLRYEGPPEAASFTFDDDGFCTRLTGGYVLDPSVGNTGGLGGVYGIFYATGTSLPGISSRPLPELLTRLQKRVLEPITGVGVDEYKLPKTPLADAVGGEGDKPFPPIKPPSIPVLRSAKDSVESPKIKPPLPMKKKTVAPTKPPPPRAAVSQPSPARPKARKDVEIDVDLGDPVSDAFKSLFVAKEKVERSKAPAPPSPFFAKASGGDDLRKKQLEEERKRQAEAAKSAAEVAAEAKRKRDEEQRIAADAKREQQRIEAERKKAAAEAQRTAAEAKREQQRIEAERKKAAAEAQRTAAEAKREQQRIEAERRKAAAEGQRLEAERKRVAAEEQRVSAESTREAQRIEEAERKRVAAEEQRIAAEARREAQRSEGERKKAAAEEQRAAAEAKREEQRKDAAERKKAAAEEQRAAAEAKRVAQRQEAERKKEIAEKQRAAAEAKRVAQRQEAEGRKAAAEERRVAAEAQRQEAQRKKEAVEEARRQAIAKRANAEQAARDAKAKRAAEAKAAAERVKKLKADAAAKKAAAEAAKKVKAAKPGATINLFDAFGKSAPEPAARRTSTPATMKSSSRKEAAAAAKKVMKEAKPGATINLFSAFGKSASGDEPPKTKPKPKVTPKKEAAAAAENAVKQAKRGATISLFSAFLKSPEGEKGDVAETKGTMFAAKKPALRGPKGIPALTKWRKMRDGSVTGNIFGSSSFEEGEKVTTSAIVRGEFAAGNVVQTQSGSKYFLGEK